MALATVLALALTVSLGRWQLNRAAQKEALATAIETRQHEPALPASELQALAQAPELLHRQVQLRGRWLPQHTVYLDNRQLHGRPGFWVFTPLQLEPEGGVVLIQRGWVARNFQDRSAVAPIETPAGLVQLQGRVASWPARLWQFAAEPPLPAAGGVQASARIRQNLEIGSYRQQSGLALPDYTVLQLGPASDGLQRDWPAADNGVHKHYGYALQWFGLAALIIVLYVWFQIVRRYYPARRPQA